MDFDEEGIARTQGVSPGLRRLQVGLCAIVGREDGAVVKLFPDGREEVLHPPKEGADGSNSSLADDPSGQST